MNWYKVVILKVRTVMGTETKVEKSPSLKKLLGKHPVLIITSICSICFAVVAGLFAYMQISIYESGILEVCATQQDAYVQLVLDQINIKSNRDDEQIIKEILGTMDASSNRYWTFSKDQSMLFVKDVTETNKYKGVTPATYYISDSAKDFLDSLTVNNVTHSYIDVNDNRYIASGVMFEYRGNQYRLCLLTEKEVLLDNNTYLEVKTQMQTFVVVILMLLVVVPMLFAHFIRRMQFTMDRKDDSITAVNRILSNMNQKISESDLHDTRNNMWNENALSMFLEKLKKRNVYPVIAVYIKCDSKSSRAEFIAKAYYILDKHVLRFQYDDSDIVLVFVQISEESAVNSLNSLMTDKCKFKKSVLIKDNTDVTDTKKLFME